MSAPTIRFRVSIVSADGRTLAEHTARTQLLAETDVTRLLSAPPPGTNRPLSGQILAELLTDRGAFRVAEGRTSAGRRHITWTRTEPTGGQLRVARAGEDR